MTENNEEECPVCLVKDQELKSLPCWHCACLPCIGKMVQDQQQLLRCPVCRAVCLSENFRHFPRATRCEICKKFLMNPRRFSACTHMCCSKCIEMHLDEYGNASCPCHCRPEPITNLHPVWICNLCHRYYDGSNLKCGHAVCGPCQEKLISEKSGCKVCSASAGPWSSTPELQQILQLIQNFAGDLNQLASRVANAQSLSQKTLGTSGLLCTVAFILHYGISVWLLLPLIIWCTDWSHQILFRIWVVGYVVCWSADIMLTCALIYYHFYELILYTPVALVISYAKDAMMNRTFEQRELIDFDHNLVISFWVIVFNSLNMVVTYFYFSPVFMHQVVFVSARGLFAARAFAAAVAITNRGR